MDRPTVAVVGAGFSGALTALNILDTPGSSARVLLIERAERFGVGVAFGAGHPDHLLNVRAMNMSADPDAQGDFARWLGSRRGGPPEPFAFASRAEYGAYIQERLRGVVQGPAAVDRLDLIGDEVTAIRKRAGGFDLSLGLGRGVTTDTVVLATGNAPPSLAALPDPEFVRHPAYIGDPWAEGALDAVAPDDPVLLLGAGLTTADVMASLEAGGHHGPVLALSRRGLVPQRHAPAQASSKPWSRRPAEPLSASLRRFRRDVDAAGEWRGLFDALRERTQAHWKTMPIDERARFLRHLRPWWDIHRHRLAPVMAERLQHWRADRLEIVAGRLEALIEVQGKLTATWKPRGETRTQSRCVRHVVNCTGPEGDPAQSRSPLMRQLLEAGLIRADPSRLGLDVTESGRVIGADGRAHRRLFAIGPVARGALWEVTAVPDIRVEARRLGRRLAKADKRRAREDA